VRNFRNDMYLVSEALRLMRKTHQPDIAASDWLVLNNYKKHVDNATRNSAEANDGAPPVRSHATAGLSIAPNSYPTALPACGRPPLRRREEKTRSPSHRPQGPVAIETEASGW
jgi:hypothetical protein